MSIFKKIIVLVLCLFACLSVSTLTDYKEVNADETDFYIEAIEDITIKLQHIGYPELGSVQIAINDGSYAPYNYGDTLNLNAGDKCYWKIAATTGDFDFENHTHFLVTGKYNIGGKISSLIGDSTVAPRNGCFRELFMYSSGLTSAANLDLNLNFNGKTSVFESMFTHCDALIAAPALPVTTLTNKCYKYMFQDCSSLTVGPELPALVLGEECYAYMFQGTSLTASPELPATN